MAFNHTNGWQNGYQNNMNQNNTQANMTDQDRQQLNQFVQHVEHLMVTLEQKISTWNGQMARHPGNTALLEYRSRFANMVAIHSQVCQSLVGASHRQPFTTLTTSLQAMKQANKRKVQLPDCSPNCQKCRAERNKKVCCEICHAIPPNTSKCRYADIRDAQYLCKVHGNPNGATCGGFIIRIQYEEIRHREPLLASHEGWIRARILEDADLLFCTTWEVFERYRLATFEPQVVAKMGRVRSTMVIAGSPPLQNQPAQPVAIRFKRCRLSGGNHSRYDFHFGPAADQKWSFKCGRCNLRENKEQVTGNCSSKEYNHACNYISTYLLRSDEDARLQDETQRREAIVQWLKAPQEAWQLECAVRRLCDDNLVMSVVLYMEKMYRNSPDLRLLERQTIQPAAYALCRLMWLAETHIECRRQSCVRFSTFAKVLFTFHVSFEEFAVPHHVTAMHKLVLDMNQALEKKDATNPELHGKIRRTLVLGSQAARRKACQRENNQRIQICLSRAQKLQSHELKQPNSEDRKVEKFACIAVLQYDDVKQGTLPLNNASEVEEFYTTFEEMRTKILRGEKNDYHLLSPPRAAPQTVFGAASPMSNSIPPSSSSQDGIFSPPQLPPSPSQFLSPSPMNDDASEGSMHSFIRDDMKYDEYSSDVQLDVPMPPMDPWASPIQDSPYPDHNPNWMQLEPEDEFN